MMNQAEFAAQTTRSTEQAKKQYTREAILSASPNKLLVMLYDRLLLDLHRAHTAQSESRWDDASEQLLHAQAIIAELRSSLKVDQWDGAVQLQGIYSFVTQELISANVGKDATKTQACIGILEPLRLTWHEALAKTTEVVSPVTSQGTPGTTTTNGGLLGVG